MNKVFIKLTRTNISILRTRFKTNKQTTVIFPDSTGKLTCGYPTKRSKKNLSQRNIP